MKNRSTPKGFNGGKVKMNVNMKKIERKLLEAYEANKEDLEELKEMEKAGELPCECSVSESFEQGYNNALKYALEIIRKEMKEEE